MNVYSSAAAMHHLETWQSTVAQNLAAGQQPGYKAVHVALERPGAGPSGKVVPMLTQATRDFSPAAARHTGRDLDVALGGDGFIIAQDAGERPVLLRNGALHVNAEGLLCTGGGLLLEGRDGPIQVVPNEPDPRIDARGEVWQGEVSIGRIRVATVDDPGQLLYDGSGWRLPGAPIIELRDLEEPALIPGYLEEGNFSSLRGMITLMQITRAFEANQKVLHAIDETVDRTLRATAS
jgi:flagellar basal-body rod protein FlgF